MIAGDFNSTRPGFPHFERGEDGRNAIEGVLEAGYKTRPVEEPTQRELTFRSDDPAVVIDWVMVPESWWFVGGEVEGWYLSDHRMVVGSVYREEDLIHR
jgi:hypothetical protein